jgi:hypothetical protein
VTETVIGEETVTVGIEIGSVEEMVIAVETGREEEEIENVIVNDVEMLIGREEVMQQVGMRDGIESGNDEVMRGGTIEGEKEMLKIIAMIESAMPRGRGTKGVGDSSGDTDKKLSCAMRKLIWKLTCTKNLICALVVQSEFVRTREANRSTLSRVIWEKA